MDLVWSVMYAYNVFVLIYFLVLNGIYLFMTFAAFRPLTHLSRRMRYVDLDEIVSAYGAPPITLVAPAYNEEETCVEAIRSLLTLRYPEYEILMVNDGSKDRTRDVMIETFDMVAAPRGRTSHLSNTEILGIYTSQRYPNLTLIDKKNGGKADALNVGVSYCKTPLFCAMDADTLMDRNALLRVAMPFLEDKDTVAVGGSLRIVNGCTVRAGTLEKIATPSNSLAAFQIIEYIRAFLVGRLGWDNMNGMLIISGAFGVFKRSLVAEIGGFSTDTVGEDMELVVRIHRHCLENDIPYKITFVPDPVAWTEVPESMKVLSRQRERWQRGLIETLHTHRKMFLNPKYGKVGLLVFPYFVLFEMLSPVIEIFGYFTVLVSLYFGRISIPFALAFLAAAIILGIVLSVSSLALVELSFSRYQSWKDFMRLLLFALTENLGYRQITNSFRLLGIIKKLRGKSGWGKMERKGFSSGPRATTGGTGQ